MNINLLIVDDEPYIRKGIMNKLKWDELGINTPEEANDGIQAMEFLNRNDVDIVLTDIKMPGMDGIRFIEEAKKQFGNRHKFVIISGYGEFEYARQALKFGVTDYLLKPIKEDELEDVIKKIVCGVISDNNEKSHRELLEVTYSNNKVMLRDRLLNELLEKNADETTIRENLRTFGIELVFNNFIVAIFKLENMADYSGIPAEKDRDYKLYKVRNILEGVFSEYIYSYVFMNNRNSREFIILFNTHDVVNRNLIKKLSFEAINQVEKRLNIKSSLGLGRPCNKIGELSKSFSHAAFAVKEKLLKGSGKVYDIEDIQVNSVSGNILYNESKKLFYKYLQQGKKDCMAKTIDDLFGIVTKNCGLYNHAFICEECLEVYTLLSDCLKRNNKNISELLGERFEFLESLMELESLNEVSSWLKSCCSIVIDFLSKDKNMTGEEIVREVKNYIDARYYENISLNFISQKYFIHPNYFCRIFRTVVGESFSDYLTGVRMERAKELMRNHGLKLNKICEAIGYDDPRYFSQVFKKFFGMSPSEYQSSMG